MFIRLAGERFRVLKQGTGGAWVIAYDEYQMPRYVSRDELDRAERIAAPEEYARNMERPKSNAQQQRYDLLARRALEDLEKLLAQSPADFLPVSRDSAP